MDTFFPSLLLSLWLKCFINWVVVTVQRDHLIRSFSGFFCISLALLDSFFSLTITIVYYLEDLNISGWRLTRYHACLLPQIACLVCAVLHWPVFLLGVLDHFWTLSPIASHVSRVQKLAYATAACLLWILATCYVFWLPDVVLLPGDVRNQCDLFSSSQSVQVLCVLVMTVAWVILYSFTPCVKPRGQEFQHATRGTQQSCFLVSRQIMFTFLNTWAIYIILMLVLLLLQMELNAYLEMNSVWLCFLNSFSVAMALCGRSFVFDSRNIESVTDGFCSWSFTFMYRTENVDKGPIQALDGKKIDSQDGEKLHIFLN
ncbi:probable G-protein coupled receptor 160 [Triplophysa dalaica]|uniref:probable G-protein coupled receptor 160 n=1 Tax=Triplophysa dalaica TaxID=1582913 RepID=UPI0024DF496A|nr:probable G-protein coupled receptor 160 [Triplophysa dalaica]